MFSEWCQFGMPSNIMAISLARMSRRRDLHCSLGPHFQSGCRGERCFEAFNCRSNVLFSPAFPPVAGGAPDQHNDVIVWNMPNEKFFRLHNCFDATPSFAYARRLVGQSWRRHWRRPSCRIVSSENSTSFPIEKRLSLMNYFLDWRRFNRYTLVHVFMVKN